MGNISNASKREVDEYDGASDIKASIEKTKRHRASIKTLTWDVKIWSLCENSFSFQLDNLEGIEKEKNFETFPPSLIHKVLLYCRTDQVSVVMRTCKLFYRISNTQGFWKEYTMSVYRRRVSREKETSTASSMKKNWKRTFFSLAQVMDPYFTRLYDTPIDPEDYQKIRKPGDGSRQIVFETRKIVLMGSKGCGKTSLMESFIGRNFNSEISPTLGAAFVSRIVKRKEGNFTLQLDIWDTSGDVRFSSIQEMYYTDAYGVIVCFSLDSQSNFREAQRIIDSVCDFNTSRSLIFLVGTASDLSGCENDRIVSREDVDEFMKAYSKKKNIIGYVETSSKTRTNVFTPFLFLSEVCYEANRLEGVEKKKKGGGKGGGGGGSNNNPYLSFLKRSKGFFPNNDYDDFDEREQQKKEFMGGKKKKDVLEEEVEI